MTAFTTCVNSVIDVFLTLAGSSGFVATVRQRVAPNGSRLCLPFQRAWEAIWGQKLVRSLYNDRWRYHGGFVAESSFRSTPE